MKLLEAPGADRFFDPPVLGWDDREVRATSRSARAALAGLSVLSTCGVLSTWLIPHMEAHAALAPELRVAGLILERERDAQAIARRFLAQTTVLEANGVEQRVTREALGVRVDTPHLALLLAAASDGRSALRRLHPRTPVELPMPAHVDPARALPVLLALKHRVDRAPVEPQVALRAGKISSGQAGVALDVYATLARLELALHQGSTRVPAVLASVPTRLRTNTLETLELDTLLSQFETPYQADAGDRTHNLQLAASKIDGYVLQPGATFDFNAVVGGRHANSGFRMAPVIADGELARGMGGGTCQIASTLHAAAFFAGLPILERVPHSRPSFYIKLGLDATVVFGAQNFVFKNDRDRPLVIGMSVERGRVHATLHGLRRERHVKFIRHIDAFAPFEERTSLDPSLPAGLRVLAQRGVPGFTITRERVITHAATGEEVRERDREQYPPTAQLWRVGAGGEAPPGFVRPRNDAHPEYIADEHLELTLTTAGNFEWVRDAGRTGSYGWTERSRRPGQQRSGGPAESSERIPRPPL